MAPRRSVSAGNMSEKDLDRRIRRIFNDINRLRPNEEAVLLTFHPYGQGGYQAGFPDWVILGPKGRLWRELKTANGRLTSAQQTWIARLRDLGDDVDVWRPADLYSGRITAELLTVAGLPQGVRRPAAS